MENELFSILEDDAQDRNTHRACLRAVARANKQFSAFFKQAASDDDYMARFELVRDRVSDIVREACVEEGSTSLDTVARVLAGELARLSESKTAAAPFGRHDMYPQSPSYSENEQDRGVDERDSLYADQMRADGICPYCHEQHDEMDHFPEEFSDDEMNGLLLPGGHNADDFNNANGPESPLDRAMRDASTKTGAPRRQPVPKMDEGTGRMYQPAKNPPRKKKAPVDPNAPDSLDPMKNKNVVRTPDGKDPLDKPVNQQQLDWNEKNKNKVRGESLHDAPTGKSLRELEGLAPLRPGELKADDEAAFLRAQSAAEPETGDTYSQERVDLPAAGPNGVSEDPSPKMDKGTAGDEQHTFQKPVVVDSEKGNVQQQDIHDKADYTKKLEPSGVLQSIDAEKGIQPELNPGPDTDTWSGTKDQANPVTSKWKVLG